MGQDGGGYSCQSLCDRGKTGVFLPLFWVKLFLTKRFQKAPRKLASFNLNPIESTHHPFRLGEGGGTDADGGGKPIHGKAPKISPKPKSSKQQKQTLRTKTLAGGWFLDLFVGFVVGMFFLNEVFQLQTKQENKHITHHTSPTFNFSFPFHPSIHPITQIHQGSQ